MLRYCISCASHRPIQEAERLFFQTIDTGAIPVVVVFTQYDRRTKEHLSELADDPQTEDMPALERRKLAAEKAFDDHEHNYKGEVLKTVEKGANVSICRIGFSKGSEVEDDGHSKTDLLGTSALITETLHRLDSGRLRLIWMVAQWQRADYLLKASVEGCIEHFWTVQKMNRFPVPVLGIGSIAYSYSDILATLCEIWKIKTTPPIC